MRAGAEDRGAGAPSPRSDAGRGEGAASPGLVTAGRGEGAASPDLVTAGRGEGAASPRLGGAGGGSTRSMTRRSTSTMRSSWPSSRAVSRASRARSSAASPRVREESRSRISTMARTTKTDIRTACGLWRTFAAMTAPFSVKAKGSDLENFSSARWSRFATTSFLSPGVRRIAKSRGNRRRLRFTCSLRRLVVTPESAARSASRTTRWPRIVRMRERRSSVGGADAGEGGVRDAAGGGDDNAGGLRARRAKPPDPRCAPGRGSGAAKKRTPAVGPGFGIQGATGDGLPLTSSRRGPPRSRPGRRRGGRPARGRASRRRRSGRACGRT